VAAEEEIEARAEEPAVSLRMAGQMNYLEAAPVRQLHVRLQRLVYDYRPVAEERPAAGFQHSADAAWAAVGKSPIDMRLFRWMGVDRCAAQSLNVSQVAGVIEVSVSQKDCPDTRPTEADSFERAFELGHLTGESGIHQHRFLVQGVVQEMEV